MKIRDVDVFFREGNKNIITVLSFIVCLIFGCLELLSGNEYSFSVLYMAPVMLSAWYGGWINGSIISAAAALTLLSADLLTGIDYSWGFIPYINAFTRTLLFLAFSTLVYIVKKQLYRETSFANQDFLTKISNSRAFYNYASMEMARLKRYKAPFTLVYFDVDNFKSVNDNYGHNEGDTLLLEIARVIRKHIRPTDVVARLGGDEFAVLLLETNARQAHLTICKLQKILKNSAKIKERKITFSFGVVVFIKSPKSVDDMIKKADEMMYISKHAGKDTANYFVYRH